MNNIISVSAVTIGFEEVNAVDARELWVFLEVETRFNDWIKKRIDDYEFTCNSDYLVLSNPNYKGIGNAPVEYTISLDMAKELSMVERNEKGREARKYFLECEKKLKSQAPPIPKTYAEALRIAADQAERIEQQQAQIEHDRPKVEFAKVVEGTTEKISIGAMAKLSGKIGRNTLFKKMREAKILMHSNIPYQKYCDQGYFEVSESVIKRTQKDQIILTTHVTGKGQLWLSSKIDSWV